MRLRTTAREIFLDALKNLDVRKAIQRALVTYQSQLHIGEACYDTGNFVDIAIIAVGKAALPMTEGLLEALQPTLTPEHAVRGIVIGSTLPATPDPRLLYYRGSHPLPDANSAEAARSILGLLASATEHTLIFFLLSGGASAMIELPLSQSINLSELNLFHARLVHSGLSITEMNTLRKHLSAVKGGRLGTAAPRATKCTLLVSDVPPARPEVIGSGPSLPDPTTLADCRHLLTTRLAQSSIPSSIQVYLNSSQASETPKSDDPAFLRATHHMLLSSNDLAFAAQSAARARGFDTLIDQTPDEWHYRDASTYLLSRLHEFARTRPGQPVCLINTGEVSVPIVISNPGTGGRNQHFALSCAAPIANTLSTIAILSAGSDGADGNSTAAGAVVDSSSLERATQLGLDIKGALTRFNSFPALEALGDAIVTGPTGNNLRDLRLLLLYPRSVHQP